MPKRNIDVRQEIERAGVPYWAVAAEIGISDTTFSKWLRFELPEDKKQLIFQAINSLKKENEKNG